MIRAKRSRQSIGFLLVLLLILNACSASEVNQTTPQGLEPLPDPLPKGRSFHIGSRSQDELIPFAELPDAEAQRYPLPEGYTVLAHLEGAVCYLLDAAAQRLLRWDLVSGEQRVVLDLSESEDELGQELAFTEERLLWLRLDPWREAQDGAKFREIRLMLTDLASGQSQMIDEASLDILDWPFLPFDHLQMEGETIAYRGLSFANGWRRTRIQLLHIESGERRVLAEAGAEEGHQILSCHLKDGQLIWDMQTLQAQYYQNLPPQSQAFYSIMLYDLVDTSDPKEDEPRAPEQLTRNDDYFAPRLYRGQVIALQQQASVNEDTRLILISPFMNLVSPLVDNQCLFLQEILLSYDLQKKHRGLNPGLPLRRANRHQPYIDNRYLSWQSNLADKHILFDIANYRYTVLPAELLSDSGRPFDALGSSFWLRALPSFSADAYLLGFHGETDARYLLCLS